MLPFAKRGWVALPMWHLGIGTASQQVENLVIIGSGPAGYTAAIYASRANLKPVMFEGLSKGGVRGGQLMTTTEVENFPGFPDGITGPDLMDRMRGQAERWGTELYTEDVEEVDLSQRPFRVRSTDREVLTHSLVVATGATAKRLGIASEAKFWSNGISACAICDGASPMFKGKEVAVVGGGDTATEEALYLTKYAKHVHLLVRGATMRASKTMQDRVLQSKQVTVHLSTEVLDVVEEARSGAMAGLKLRDTATGAERTLDVRGMFYGIGHKPNSELIRNFVTLDESGYVLVKPGTVSTNVDGVFVAGDLQDQQWRQAITAAGSGCMAALSVERYLSHNGLIREFHQKEEVGDKHGGAGDKKGKKKKARKEVEEGEEEESIEEMRARLEAEFDPARTKHQGQYALRKLYHETDRLLGVLYTAPTCGPCRTLKPILSKVVDEYADKVHWVEIDIEQDPEIAEAAGVQGTPTVHLFKNKARLENISGVKMKSFYRELIETHLKS
eukprot:jgi/Mesvir1/4740/Mv05532-RA.1